ncbi:MAG: hypothetical protein WCT19_04450 [Candidatus Paceibacterota bacterium]|jgi:hypothetical protein
MGKKGVSHKKMGAVQEKILLLLLGGVALGLSRSPKKYFKVLNLMVKEWKNINRRSLENSIRLLYRSHLIEEKENPDGTVTMVLNKEGRKLALHFDIYNIRIKKPTKWDEYWRIVIFDIPERFKKLRNLLRFHLQNMGFVELQKSVFVHPFPCFDEIEYIIETYKIRKYVRTILAKKIDNELDLKRHFDLL